MATQVTMSAVLTAIQTSLITNLSDCGNGNTYICAAPLWVEAEGTKYAVQVCPNGVTRYGGIIAKAGSGYKFAGRKFGVLVSVYGNLPIDEQGRHAAALTDTSIGMLQLVNSIENQLGASLLKTELDAASFEPLNEPLQWSSTSEPIMNPDRPGQVRIDIVFTDALGLLQ